MAKVKYGEMIAAMSGKVNGSVHSKNRFGAYMRNKVTPVNPQSTAQTLVRAAFASFTQGWRGLTDAQRAAWAAAVDTFQKINVFGDSIRLTPANLYIGLNRKIATCGGSAISVPPIPSAVTALTSVSIDADVSDATIVATYAPAIPAAQSLVVYATPPQSAGVKFVKNKLRKIDVMVTADASPFDLTSAYEAVFGTGWKTAGQKLFFSFEPVITAKGINAPGFQSETTVVA